MVTKAPDHLGEAEAEEDALLPGANGVDAFDDLPDRTAPVEVEVVSMYASLVDEKGKTGSTQSGATATLKFEISPADSDGLWRYMGEQAFDVTFAKAALGRGLTISGIQLRPDADGAARAYMTLIVPTTEMSKVASIYSRNLLGKHDLLVMDAAQMSMEHLLATKAE